MPYTAQISRDNPTFIVFLIDQSGSMKDTIAGTTTNRSKADGVADAVNRLLSDLVDKSTKELGKPPRDYFDVAVIGYGQSVGPAFGGKLAGRQMAKISEIADNPLRVEERQRKVEDGAGGLVNEKVNFAVWFDPVSQGGTPMCQTLRLVHDLLGTWIPSHMNSFPPIVINITDGESTDTGDPLVEAEAIKNLCTNDGNVLLFNCDISASAGSKVLFPESDASLPDVSHERRLFKMSSELPEGMLRAAQAQIQGVQSGARGFAFQADLAELIQFLDIGTRIDLNLR